MIFKPHPLSTSQLPLSELEKDRKSCRKVGPCGVGKKAIYLNSFYIDRCYYIPFTAVRRVFKRVAMSKGGFSGKGMFASIPYLVVEYDDGQQKQCNFKYENQVDDLLNLLSAEQPQIRLLSEAAERKMEKQKAEMLKIVQELQEKYFLEKNICIEVCQAFYSAIGVEKVVFEENNSMQQYTGDEINRGDDGGNKEEKNYLRKEECVAQESIQNKNDSININNTVTQKKQGNNKVLVILLILLALLFIGVEYLDIQKEKGISSIEFENEKYGIENIITAENYGGTSLY